MFSPEFDYYRASSVSEALDLLGEHSEAKLLAGGHSLIPILKLRLAAPSALIDIGRIDGLKGIERNGGTVSIGALTTHAEIAASAVVRDAAAALAEAAGQIGDPAVRNRGTIGGNVAHADPASDLPAVLACLDTEFEIVGPDGQRTVAAGDFFQGLMTTSLGEREVLSSIRFAAAGSGESSAYAKFAHPASRYAVTGVAAKVALDGGTVTSASVALGGLVPAPVRAASVEAALTGQVPSAGTLDAASRKVVDSLPEDEVLGDVFASAGYRKASAHVWVRRALEAAVARAA